MNQTLLEDYLNSRKKLINKHLDLYLSTLVLSFELEGEGIKKPSKVLSDSMKYSVIGGGKRLRPILALAGTEFANGDIKNTIPTACALELIHTQSLIHDDLPIMDNDDFRRGQSSNHKVFGEPIALLAGDALLAYAFELIATQTPLEVEPQIILKVISEIAGSAGFKGICLGQAADLKYTACQNLNEDILQYIHINKTGALIKTAVRAGGLLGNATEQQLNSLTAYANYIGLAFQIVDDILDVTGQEAKIGKSIGKDKNLHKATYPAVYGIEESKVKAECYMELAINSLKDSGKNANILIELAKYIINRQL